MGYGIATLPQVGGKTRERRDGGKENWLCAFKIIGMVEAASSRVGESETDRQTDGIRVWKFWSNISFRVTAQFCYLQGAEGARRIGLVTKGRGGRMRAGWRDKEIKPK